MTNRETEARNRSINLKKFRMTAGPNILGIMEIINYAKTEIHIILLGSFFLLRVISLLLILGPSSLILPYLPQKYPHTLIGAHGEAVGLTPGNQGNSEVGHLNIGAGKFLRGIANYKLLNL